MLFCLTFSREATGLLTPSASEVVDLEPAWIDPTAAFEASDTECPHHGSGLISWTEAWATLPVAGEDVTLPENTKVLITSSPLSNGQALGLITVPSTSELIIGENLSDGISLDMTGMEIYGKFLAGASGCRLSSYITLTLHGVHPGGKLKYRKYQCSVEVARQCPPLGPSNRALHTALHSLHRVLH